MTDQFQTTEPVNIQDVAEANEPAPPTTYEECDALALAIADKRVASLREATKAGHKLSDFCQVDPELSVEEALAAEHHDVFMDKAADFNIWLLHRQAEADLSKVIDDLSLFYINHPLGAAARLLVQEAKKRPDADAAVGVEEVLGALIYNYGFAQVREKFNAMAAEIEADIEAENIRRTEPTASRVPGPRPWANPKPREPSPAQE
jgi:hypothetical protein